MIPLCSRCPRMKWTMAAIFSFLLSHRRTVREMFGRSNDDMNVWGVRSRNCSRISFRVILSAVAVRATTGTFGKRSFKIASCVYSGRKSCPQCDTQCASSIAMSEMSSRGRNQSASILIRSGEIYNNLILPCTQSCFTCCCSSSGIILFNAAAGMPLAINPST